ncbi:histone-like nucleoid-structuring protein Lsr2 [Streptomyces smyrnaeus]|uniref:histone-like nucleoid-structuring protein Lsr2 n=1 Tax=Streptomyces smyrnaeus TaxID=1387713 RepID=UPI00367EE3E1
MARRQIVTILVDDDLTGQELAEEEADTLTFTLDGVSVELDTSKEEANKVREFLARYMAAGTIVPTRGGGRRTGVVSARPVPSQAPASRPAGIRSDRDAARQVLNDKVRAWAKANDMPVKDRGRIASNIYEAYAQATGEDISAARG